MKNLATSKFIDFLSKNWRVIFLIITLIVFVYVVVFFSIDARGTVTPGILDYTIVIDAGHGGVDGGVLGVSSGVKESDLNLAYAKALEELLITAGFDTVMTRNDKGGLYGLATNGFKRRDMEARREIIRNAKPMMVVSVHMNKFRAESRKGAQVFYQVGDSDSMLLAQDVQKTLNKVTGGKYNALKGDFYICRCYDCPSIIVECGFLSNKQEELLLQQEDYMNKIINAVYDGIILYMYEHG